MQKTWFIFLVFLLCLKTQGQNKDSLRNNYTNEPHDFSFVDKWKYFKLKRTITIKIIHHTPPLSACGVLMTASSTIALTEKGDTIRILDLCNIRSYKTGQIIKVNPFNYNPKCDYNKKKNCWIIPFTLIENPLTGKFEPTQFDLTIKKTTYGTLIE